MQLPRRGAALRTSSFPGPPCHFPPSAGMQGSTGNARLSIPALRVHPSQILAGRLPFYLARYTPFPAAGKLRRTTGLPRARFQRLLRLAESPHRAATAWLFSEAQCRSRNLPWRFGAARLRTSEVFVHCTERHHSKPARFVPEKDKVPRSTAVNLQRGTFVGLIPRTVHSRRRPRPRLLPCAGNPGEPLRR